MENGIVNLILRLTKCINTTTRSNGIIQAGTAAIERAWKVEELHFYMDCYAISTMGISDLTVPSHSTYSTNYYEASKDPPVEATDRKECGCYKTVDVYDSERFFVMGSQTVRLPTACVLSISKSISSQLSSSRMKVVRELVKWTLSQLRQISMQARRVKL